MSFKKFMALCMGLCLMNSVFADSKLLWDGGKLDNQIKIKKTSQALEIETAGGDPYAVFKPSTALKAVDEILEFEYFCPDGINSFVLYAGPPFRPGGAIEIGALPKSEGWMKKSFNLSELSGGAWGKESAKLIRFDFGSEAGVRLQIKNVILRAASKAEKEGLKAAEAARAQTAAEDAALRAYFEKNLSAKILSVAASKDSIEISGELGSAGGGLKLAEVPFWEHAKPNIAIFRTIDVASSANGNARSFKIRLPRIVDGRDLLVSKWALVSNAAGAKATLASQFAYASDFKALQNDLPPKIKPSSKKGMTCMGPDMKPIWDELLELGVKHVNMNFLLNQFLYVRDGETPIKHTFNGKTVKISPSWLKANDACVKFCTDNGIVVSAIILLNFVHEDIAKSICNPKAENAGTYAMPDLSSENGFKTYAAVLDFLAKHYAERGLPNGRVDNWIMHNEVDYGYNWTNMGRTPMHIFMDEYMRSMRLMEILARAYNPDARVFISLTHNWVSLEDPAWQTYSPRAMLDFLALSSKAEGDFEWGVAYHPYPESLFRPTAWDDSQSLLNYDTPMVTIKNIEVLISYLNKPAFLRKGKPRTVMFTEQGFHTEYTDKGFAEQSAAFIYTWKRISNIANVECFHNHRWFDHPAEGGLKLGLRTLPQDGKPFGDKKPAWEVYKALETPEIAKYEADAKKIIGARNYTEADTSKVRSK